MKQVLPGRLRRAGGMAKGPAPGDGREALSEAKASRRADRRPQADPVFKPCRPGSKLHPAAFPTEREGKPSPQASRERGGQGTGRFFTNKSGRFRLPSESTQSRPAPGARGKDAPTARLPVSGTRLRAPAPRPIAGRGSAAPLQRHDSRNSSGGKPERPVSLRLPTLQWSATP